MHPGRHRACELALGRALAAIRVVVREQRAQLRERPEREQAQEPRRIGVGHVQPVLVELVRARTRGVEPDALARRRLPHLLPGGVEQQRRHEPEQLCAPELARQLAARGDVAVLVGAADLEATALRAGEVHEVVRLQQHVRELGVADAGLALEAAADGVLRRHVVDRQVLADVAQELEIPEASHPVGVVRHARPGGGVIEREQPAELGADPRDVRGERGVVEQVALVRLARGIADHARRAADDDDRPVPRELEALEQDRRHEVADVEARRGGVVARVDGDDLRGEQPGETLAVGGLLEQMACRELVEQRHGANVPYCE